MAGAERPRNVAPEVAANRSRISVARVGWIERLAAPLSCRISVACRPAHRETASHGQHRAAPGNGDRAAGPLLGQHVHGHLGHGLPRQVVGSLARGGGGHVRDPGSPQMEALDQPVLEVHQPRRWMHDLDPDDRLCDRPIQESTDLEPAEAQSFADLGLRQVHPVVELGDPHHQADVVRAPAANCEHCASVWLHI